MTDINRDGFCIVHVGESLSKFTSSKYLSFFKSHQSRHKNYISSHEKHSIFRLEATNGKVTVNPFPSENGYKI